MATSEGGMEAMSDDAGGGRGAGQTQEGAGCCKVTEGPFICAAGSCWWRGRGCWAAEAVVWWVVWWYGHMEVLAG
jgi:hypothetical protein